jgi:hypothetical protein
MNKNVLNGMSGNEQCRIEFSQYKCATQQKLIVAILLSIT